jgi:hypothetical protein
MAISPSSSKVIEFSTAHGSCVSPSGKRHALADPGERRARPASIMQQNCSKTLQTPIHHRLSHHFFTLHATPINVDRPCSLLSTPSPFRRLNAKAGAKGTSTPEAHKLLRAKTRIAGNHHAKALRIYSGSRSHKMTVLTLYRAHLYMTISGQSKIDGRARTACDRTTHLYH